MSLIFECIQTEGIAELSYLLGDDDEGIAAIFDPRTDVEIYLQRARELKVSISHIFETHIHADLVSGARELCARVESAKIFVSGEGGAQYGFDCEKVKDGDRFEFGDTIITVKHTPGHTPEHISFLLAESDRANSPWGVLTGDSLFVNSAGRPDLLGEKEAIKLADQQFHTLRDFFLGLPDGVVIHPAHGAGSPCGAEIGDRLNSTIGYERKYNPFLQIADVKAFTDYALSTAPPVPNYYPRMKKVNAEGPEVLGNLPRMPGLPPKNFKDAVERKENILVDTRTMLAFGASHIGGALNIAGTPMLSIWAGALLDPDEPILLVLEKDEALDEIVRYFLRTGFTKFAGYLVGGMPAWENAGYPHETVRQMSIHELHQANGTLQILDVRSPREWKAGRIRGAKHIYLSELRARAGEIERSKPIAVYCASGYRASAAASILKQEGFSDVSNVPGSWRAWRKAGFPVEK